MKYNKSEIMKVAWAIFRKWAAPYKYYNTAVPACYNFASALKKAWADAKQVAEKVASGIVRMEYAQYKREYANCKTVDGSYDKATKTIEVMTRTIRTFASRPSVTAIRGLCPRCHTYCYGDCLAAM